MRVLVLSDAKEYADVIGEWLKEIWCETDIEKLERDTLPACQPEHGDAYDAIVLAGEKPVPELYPVIAGLRKGGLRTPILYVEKERRRKGMVRALEAGADYYLGGPFGEAELAAALKAVLRRYAGEIDATLQAADLALNMESGTLTGPGGKTGLGKKEIEVLAILMRNSGRIVPKERILLNVWGRNSEAVDNNVEIYISFLRKKLQKLHADVRIRTLRGLGYRLETAGT